MVAFWFGCLIWGWIFYHALFHPKRFLEKEGDDWWSRGLLGGSYLLFAGLLILLAGVLLSGNLVHHYISWADDLVLVGGATAIAAWVILSVVFLCRTWTPWPGYERKKKDKKTDWFESLRKLTKDAGDDPVARAVAFFRGVMLIGLVVLLIVAIIILLNLMFLDPRRPMTFFRIATGTTIFGLVGLIIAVAILVIKKNS